MINGDKGWRKFGDNVMELEADGIANEKRTIYLSVLPATLVPLRARNSSSSPPAKRRSTTSRLSRSRSPDPTARISSSISTRRAAYLSSLVATVIGFRGDEFTQETTYANYKDFDGAKKATKISSRRNGEKFIEQEITDFKLIDKVPADTFAEPK